MSVPENFPTYFSSVFCHPFYYKENAYTRCILLTMLMKFSKFFEVKIVLLGMATGQSTTNSGLFIVLISYSFRQTQKEHIQMKCKCDFNRGYPLGEFG